MKSRILVLSVMVAFFFAAGAVTRAAATNYTLSVKTTGLVGTLVVTDSQSDTLTFTTNETQPFATQYASGASYTASITTQPSGQTCALSANATGTITKNTVVTATCKNDYQISATVTGLTGTLVLKDNKSDLLTFTTNDTQTFASQFTSGSAYTVSVKTQPSGQTCTLSSNAKGTITSNITVTATCVPNYKISVAVTGLVGTLVVTDSKSQNLTFTTNKTLTFATAYASGSSYTVTVTTQPTGQTCTLGSNSTGTITKNITVAATCTSNVTNYSVSVAVTGLTGTLVVADGIGTPLTFTTNTTQTFSNTYASGSTYAVTVQTQPAGQTCTLSSNSSGTITSNITVTATCGAATYSLSVAVSGLTGTVVMQDDQGATLTFSSNTTQTFSNTYASGATYTVSVTSQPTTMSCIPTYSTATINSNTTIMATCATGATRQLGTVSGVSTITCQGTVKNGVCQQMTVSCPGLPNIDAYVKTNTPSGTSKGTTLWMTGTNGTDLYDSIFTYGSTAVQDVLNAGFTTVQISWGAPFNTLQTNGWVVGPGGVLDSACRIATLDQWIYTSIQNNASLPMCATGNSGGAGSIAYALNQYNGTSNLSMVELTSGPPTARLDWGCGCTEGKVAVTCGLTPTLGTCFGKTDGAIWDPGYNPSSPADEGVCTDAVAGTLPPGGLNFFLGDSSEAPGAVFNFPNTYVNVVFGGQDNSSGVPIGFEWFDKVTSAKPAAAVCIADDGHTIPNYLDGATQIANDLISMCKIQ